MAIAPESLINKITEAFKDVTLGNGIGLTEAEAIDDYREPDFRKKCRASDEKQNWQAISSASLNQCYSSLSFFDAEGMRFHLPAYMIAEISGNYNFGTTFTLTNLSEYSQSQFVLFSPQQKQVVKLFLEFLAADPHYEYDKPDIERAITDYWST